MLTCVEIAEMIVGFVYNGKDWNVYRYGTCRNRVTGMCQLKSKGVHGEYHYTCEILKRGCK